MQTETQLPNQEGDIMSFGSLLKNKRSRLGQTQKEVAEQADVTLSHYKQLETDRANPSIDSMRKLSRVLNIDPREIFDEFDKQDPASELDDPPTLSHEATDNLRAITHIMETKSPTSRRLKQAVSSAEEELSEADYDDLEEIVADMGFDEIIEIPDPSEFEDDEQEDKALASLNGRMIVVAMYGDVVETAGADELHRIAKMVEKRIRGRHGAIDGAFDLLLGLSGRDTESHRRFFEDEHAHVVRVRSYLAERLVEAAKIGKAPTRDQLLGKEDDG